MNELRCIPYFNVLMYFVQLGDKRINPRPLPVQYVHTNNPLSCTSKTNWKTHCLCQTDTKEELKSPPTCFEGSSDGYFMIVKKITTISGNSPVTN